MGGGKDQKQANQQLTQQAAYQGSQQKSTDVRNEGDLNASRGRADQLWQELHGGYSSLAANPIGGVNGGGGGGGGGGAAAGPDKFSDAEASYRNSMGVTGGLDPNRVGNIDKDIGGLREFGQTGGWNDIDKARARGLGVYDEFSRTGGLSDADQANIRRRATSGIPALYSGMRDQANLQRSVQGGYGPGAAAMGSRLARQNASGLADANLNAELGIREKVNQGRLAGAQGASQSELALQDQIQGNRYKGMTGALGAEQGLAESVRGGQQWGTQGLAGLAENERQAAMAGSAAGAANDRWSQEFAFRQKQAALEGLGSLYGATPNEYQFNKGYGLDSASTFGNQISGGSTQLKTNNRSAWDTAGQFAGAIAGGLSPF